MEQPGQGREIQWGPLLGGAFLGLFASWGLYMLTVLVLFSSLGDVGLSDATWPMVVAAAALLLPAAVFGLLLLRQRRAGQVVAGVLLGLTIGALVGAGLCVPLVLGG